MTELIDISMPLSERIPVWPESRGATARRISSVEAGDEATVSYLEMDVHTGTHVDAPMHMIAEGAGMDRYSLSAGLGAANVVDTGETRRIDGELLNRLDPAIDCGRVLLRTANSRRPELQRAPFFSDYAALTVSGAEWMVDRGVELVGIDYLSIQRFEEPTEVHLILLRAGVVILEGLDLAAVSPGAYELICLPLHLGACEAAPARAVLRPLDA